MIACRAWLVGLSVLAAPLAAQRGNPNPMDSIRRLPGYRPAHDSVPMLTAERVSKYAPRERDAWALYLLRSHLQHAADSTAMAQELRTAGRATMVRAPYAHEFSVKPSMSAAWFASDSARRMTDVILSFQAPNGGWSKHVDFTLHPRAPGESYFGESDEWEWISTFDNQSTTEEIRFLALANRSRRAARLEQAITRGIDYLLAAQYPNGCFPQIFPLQGSYHDAATFNDDATINVLRLLRAVADGAYDMAAPAQRERARDAVAAGVECILDAQVKVNGRLTIWGQQHDPLTLAPTSARSYEPASLASFESASIVDFLMGVPSPSDRLVSAVTAAVTWMRAAPIRGYRYDVYDLKRDSTAGPLWGRMYELGTNRIIMANRDGVTLYDWNKLTDRRTGYRWYTTAPAAVIDAFDRWPARLPKRR